MAPPSCLPGPRLRTVRNVQPLADGVATAEGSGACLSLPGLPLALQALVLQHVPADQTLLLNRVNPAWKVMVDQPELWRDVKLGDGSGVKRVCNALLLAVSAKSRGTMRSLDVSGLFWPLYDELVARIRQLLGRRLRRNDSLDDDDNRLSFDVLLRVAHDSAGALQHVVLSPGWGRLGSKHVTALLAAAPCLHSLDANLSCSADEARALLRGRCAPVLRLRRLSVGGSAAASAAALVADLGAHPTVAYLALSDFALGAEALGVLVDFAVDRRLEGFGLVDCGLPLGGDGGVMPALTRLLTEGGVTSLHLSDGSSALPQGAALPPPSPAFCAALRSTRTLQELVLNSAQLWASPGAGRALLAAVTGHTSLKCLNVSCNRVARADRPAVGAALGALVAANAAALTSLDVSECGLGDEGLRSLVGVLPHNASLRILDCSMNDLARPPSLLSSLWARRQPGSPPPLCADLVAALRANTGLRVLCAYEWPSIPELKLAQALVAGRARSG